ncbi:MAG: trimeric intracellular cation channel family protein [Calditrichaeota bacterium]|nr:MAG: trimeric intracellular cation channel family protein [Calditrichota bacterium]
MNLINILDYTGTLAFAISGALTARYKRFDWFGAAVIAFVTAIGGGTLRDVLIGTLPVGWLRHSAYLWLIVLGVVLVLMAGRTLEKMRHTMHLFDTIGIAVFSLIGLEKTLAAGLSMPVAIILGAVSAVFGGVIRDTLCNETPLIFSRDVYATVCLAGGVVYALLLQRGFSSSVAGLLMVGSIILLRVLAIRLRWQLPQA